MCRGHSSCQEQIFSSELATAESKTIAENPSCGGYSGADVWFKLTVPASGNLRIELPEKMGPTFPSLVLYSGSCGNFTEQNCIQQDAGMTFFLPELANKEVYLRVFPFYSQHGGSFSICAFEPECVDDQTNIEIVHLCKGETMIFGNAIIAAPGQYSAVFLNKNGCDSLVNLTVIQDSIVNDVIISGSTLEAKLEY